MITNVPRRALFVTYADCVPVLFYDPAHQAIGACHAGWRGTAVGIVGKTVQVMTQQFGCRTENIRFLMRPP